MKRIYPLLQILTASIVVDDVGQTMPDVLFSEGSDVVAFNETLFDTYFNISDTLQFKPKPIDFSGRFGLGKDDFPYERCGDLNTAFTNPLMKEFYKAVPVWGVGLFDMSEIEIAYRAEGYHFFAGQRPSDQLVCSGEGTNQNKVCLILCKEFINKRTLSEPDAKFRGQPGSGPDVFRCRCSTGPGNEKLCYWMPKMSTWYNKRSCDINEVDQTQAHRLLLHRTKTFRHIGRTDFEKHWARARQTLKNIATSNYIAEKLDEMEEVEEEPEATEAPTEPPKVFCFCINGTPLSDKCDPLYRNKCEACATGYELRTVGDDITCELIPTTTTTTTTTPTTTTSTTATTPTTTTTTPTTTTTTGCIF